MYSDINNVALKVAIQRDPALASQVEVQDRTNKSKKCSPKVCSLYLFGNQEDEGSQGLKVFNIPEKNGDGEQINQATEANDDETAEVEEPKILTQTTD